MKVFRITAKNLKLLMRSKTSMFVVIFGPLIIMLLVGFAFNNPTASKLNIGYVEKDKTNLTTSFIDVLKSNPNFSLVEFGNSTVCKDSIEQGNVHICIIFPEQFSIENNKTNEIVFFVDQSRANFVYSIIDTVSSKISFSSSMLSYQMTNDLLSVISYTQKANEQDILKIITVKSSLDTISTKLTDVSTKLNSLDLSKSSINTGDLVDSTDTIKKDINALKTKGSDVVDLGRQLVTDMNGNVQNNGSSLMSTFNTDLDSKTGELGNATTLALTDVDSLVASIDSVSIDINKLNQKLDDAKTSTGASATQIAEMKNSLGDVKTSLDDLKSSVEKTNKQINDLKVTSAESIVNPIKTTITPITTKTTNLNFIFPYLIILIIAFISIMLSSTIIMMEKTSKAYFRNFTTPTKDFTFIISVFLTSFFVVVLQLVFIMILAYYFLNTTIMLNVWLTLLVIMMSITLFTLLGMIVGYLFNSQEAATMASISLGSVFLFLSNLILPLETMSDFIQQAAKFNPYVMASELLKKLTLFGSTWKDTYMEFALILVYIVVAFVLTLIIEKMSKIQYISKKPISKQFIKKDDIIDKYFKLKSGILIRDEKELLSELNKMSDMTYQEYVDNKKNDFESWLLLNKKHELAKIIGKARTRKEMIELIEKYNSQIVDPLKKVEADTLKKETDSLKKAEPSQRR